MYLACWHLIQQHHWYQSITWITWTQFFLIWQQSRRWSDCSKLQKLIRGDFCNKQFATTAGFHGLFQYHGVMLFRFMASICICPIYCLCKKHSSNGKREKCWQRLIILTQEWFILIHAKDPQFSIWIVRLLAGMELGPITRNRTKIAQTTWVLRGNLKRSECCLRS